MHYLALTAALALSAMPTGLWAHGGGLAADGCHNDKKNGGAPPPPQRAFSGSIYFLNCASARTAGAAPVRSGQAGYGRRLDRDGDGIGCE